MRIKTGLYQGQRKTTTATVIPNPIHIESIPVVMDLPETNTI